MGAGSFGRGCQGARGSVCFYIVSCSICEGCFVYKELSEILPNLSSINKISEKLTKAVDISDNVCYS